MIKDWFIGFWAGWLSCAVWIAIPYFWVTYKRRKR
jgi:hypothetical protein